MNRRPDEDKAAELGSLGMAIFLVSLSVLFAASLVGYGVVRFRAEAWPPPNAPALPTGLWLSTLCLLAASATIHAAHSAAQRERPRALRGALLLTTGLAVVFLVIQMHNWSVLAAGYLERPMDLYAFTFYLLTGLHAVHVVGGIVFLLVVTARAFAGREARPRRAGVRYAAMYWHFLDAVWLILFAVLLLGDWG